MLSPRHFVSRLLDEAYGPTRDDQAEIGDDVTVVADGQSYQGKVAEKDPRDSLGRVKVSFRGPRPPRQDFKPDEIKRNAEKPGTTAPGRPPSPAPVPPVGSRVSRSW